MKNKENKLGIPDEALDSLARALYPAIREYLETETGKRDYEQWEKDQCKIKNEKNKRKNNMAFYYDKLLIKLKESGMTQKELCEKASISTATMKKIKDGDRVSVRVLDRIATVFNCDYGDIITAKPVFERKDNEGKT